MFQHLHKFANLPTRLLDALRYLRSVYKIRRMSPLPDNNYKTSPVLFCILRNEHIRLPYFLDHYRSLGVQWFFILDNNSTDRTREFLLKQNDITLFSTPESYQWNLYWRRYLLNKYGKNRWCLMVDADELLIYEGCENKEINYLISQMEKEGSNHLRALWVEMYSANEIRLTKPRPKDKSLISICPYFDRTAPRLSTTERVFGWRTEFDKAPLVFYTSETIIDRGFHRIKGDSRPYSKKAVVMHFLYLFDFLEKANRESTRGVYYMGGAKYKCYNSVLENNQNICLLGEESELYINSKTFKSLGFFDMQ